MFQKWSQLLFHTMDNIFMFRQVILYEDELADNGVSLLTVKVVKSHLWVTHYIHVSWQKRIEDK